MEPEGSLCTLSVYILVHDHLCSSLLLGSRNPVTHPGLYGEWEFESPRKPWHICFTSPTL